MKKISSILIAVFFAMAASAQCVIDATLLNASPGGYYPSSAHLPHIVKDSFYSQTIQGKIQDTISIGGFLTYIVDSVRLDSILGLPNGITWQKSSNTLPGGGYGCISLNGTTSDPAGTYNTNAVGMIWAHVIVPLLGVNKDTSTYGSLNRFPQYSNFYVVVDSLQEPLTDSIRTRVNCASVTAGTATVTAYGGSPSSPYNYLWSNGATSYTINNVDTGTYWVTVTSGVDTATSSVNIVGEAAMVLTTTADTATTGNNGTASVVVTGGISPFSYQWNNGDSTAAIAGLAPGNYRVNVTDSLGCTARARATVAAPAVNGISATSAITSQISLFPNPANDLLNIIIESPVAVSGRLEVIDVTGKVVYALPADVSTTRYNQNINVSAFSPGIYILQFTSGAQSLHERFVIER